MAEQLQPTTGEIDEGDPLWALAQRLVEVTERVSQMSETVAVVRPLPMPAAMGGPPGQSPAAVVVPIHSTARGEAPSMLSPKDRRKFIGKAETAAWVLIGGSLFASICLPIVGVISDTVLPGGWQWPLVATAIVGFLVYGIAYFTVMGFGKVAFTIGTGGGPGADGQMLSEHADGAAEPARVDQEKRSQASK